MKSNYGKMSFKAAIELAAPHTWGAGIMPVVLGSVLSVTMAGAFSIPMFYSLLCTSVFLQCAVNTLNDYTDFIKGTDRIENSDDPNDASIIYNGIKPLHALLLGAAFIALAFLSGLYALITAGWELLIFGAIGAGTVILYSFGRLPIAYLPLGEMASGFTMGGIIPIACFYAYTGSFEPWIFIYSIPLMISIGMIMFTNNISDIERDTEAGRKTLPVLIGRRNSKGLHLIGTVIETAAAITIIGFRFGNTGLWLTPLMLLLVFFPESRILSGGLTPDMRINSMRGIIQIHWRLNLIYVTMAAMDILITAEHII